ncbi:uncharacterized protein N7483_013047 [Penicillium malachiteum]|uniref:uncharacterized protein n=1 Tax=Penicillium malachiteum TaxID=1324776 RepID=UPI0025483D69|nr:uncharacterized protein N7483_013047 [Penicillium malachiteum]KAJ5715866.1 hypothetical protein N7483_013047 [Penicillium malachiteum]
MDPLLRCFHHIEPRGEVFFPLSQAYFGDVDDPATECHCNLWDWDQLRFIKIKGPSKFFPPEDDAETSIFAQSLDYLSPDVREITIDSDGLLTGVSTDPDVDETAFAAYMPFSLCEHLVNCPKIYFSQLHEIGRLGPGVDLLSYNDQRVAFKFNPLRLPRQLECSWREMNIISKLPPHPNLVPFDNIVLEDKESRIIGFTTKWIPGGRLSDPKKPFRLEWLQQLTQVVDFLNFELGIMHQDIAPRNLLIDPESENILLFDFDCAAGGQDGLLEGRDDVTEIPHWNRKIDMIQNIEWTCDREPDCDVSEFRQFLNDWIANRTNGSMERYLNAPKRITWPAFQDPPDYDVPFQFSKTSTGEAKFRPGERYRRSALKNGQYCFRWQRPPQRRQPVVPL